MTNKINPSVGDRWGRVVWLGKSPGNHGKPAHRFLCDCGTEFVGRLHETVKKSVPQCRECYLKSAKGKPRPGARQSPVERTINVAWYRFQQASNNKGGVFLTKDEWLDLTQRACYYCDAPPSNLFRAVETWAEDFTYQGIDRVDSSDGYRLENCRPCCWICNRMKSNMDEEEFIDHLRRVLRKVDNT